MACYATQIPALDLGGALASGDPDVVGLRGLVEPVVRAPRPVAAVAAACGWPWRPRAPIEPDARQAAAGDARASLIRVAQAGAIVGEDLHAYVMAPKALRGERFQLLDSSGRVLRCGPVGGSAGRWNSSYDAVQPIDLGRVSQPGTYWVRISGPTTATSPAIPVGWAELRSAAG